MNDSSVEGIADRGAVPRNSTNNNNEENMSATTEKLIEEIYNVEVEILNNKKLGNIPEVSRLTQLLEGLKLQLNKANNALNENKQILKG